VAWVGKGKAFPIKGATRAYKEGDDLNAEDVLLIDPTRRNPANHIQWVEFANVSVAFPVWNTELAALDP
jgi:hypothetical protein